MRNQVPAVFLSMTCAVVGLAACTTGQRTNGDVAQAASRTVALLPAAGGVTRRGDSFAMMAEQYAPRAGPVAATGASAWVRPAPAPAFVASGPPPPADPPAPPPAAVANRQPSTPASEIERPEAAVPDAPDAAPTPPAGLRTAGLALFNSASCNACHVLSDAGAAGSIGPSLDRNPRLTRAYAIDVMINGQGAMPSFTGQLSDAEIDTLADYLVAFSRK